MDPSIYSFIIETSGQVGAFILLAWLVRRVFQHTIPRLSGDFKTSLEVILMNQKESITELRQGYVDEIGATRVDFKDELRRQRDDFKEELRHQREDFSHALREEREYLGKRIDRLSNNVEEFVSELRKGRLE